MTQPRCLRLVGALLLACASVGPPLPAFGQDESAARLLEGAKREGEVVWYTAMSLADNEAVRERFKKVYPFLTLTVLRQPGEKVRNRILAEAQAGKALWDVVSINHLDIDALNRQGLLATYHAPEARVGFPKGAVDPEGRWAAIYVRKYVLGYNTSLVAKGEAPRDWSELLEPKWKGKLGMDENEIEWFAAMLDYWGRERGLRFMRALAAQQPQFRRGHNLLTQLLVAGEFPLALVFPSELDQAKKKGAPVDWVTTTDPIVTSPSQIALAAKAPHPNAARLFASFMLSPEGQQLLRERDRYPARIDLPAADAVARLRLHYVNPKLARDFRAYEKEFEEVFQLRR